MNIGPGAFIQCMQLIEDRGGGCLLVITQDSPHIGQQAQAQPLLSLLPEGQNKRNSATSSGIRPVPAGGFSYSK